MSVVNRIIVTCRLENGDDIDVSAKVVGRSYSVEDVQKLNGAISKKIVPHVEDALHYQVRTWSGNGGKERRNWAKIKTLAELEQVISEVMVVGDETPTE